MAKVGRGDALAALALGGAGADDLLQLAADLGDLVADAALVHLELGLPRVALHRPAAALAVEVGPQPLEPGQLLLEARQLDLQHGLLGRRARGEDVEDDLLAVDDAQAGRVLLPVALLGGRELVVEDDEAAVEPLGQGRDLLHLAGADEVPRVLLAQADERLAADLHAEVRHQLAQLVEQAPRLARVLLRALEADEEGAVEALADLRVLRVDGRLEGLGGGLGQGQLLRSTSERPSSARKSGRRPASASPRT